MDSYDLFGEDGGSSMLDGLTDFGGDNLESATARDSAANYVAQQPPPQQQPQYGQPLPQESPLQKLASFGGDFGHMDTQPQQQGMYHQAHPGYSPSSVRPLGPNTGPSYQPHVRSHRPSGQFNPYPTIPENMYSMERQQSNLQGWNGPAGYIGNMRHYGGQITQPQSSYRQHMGYSQQQTQQQQVEKMPQQYAGGQMMGYQQYPPSSHFSGSYDGYGRMTHHNPYQQNTPQSPQYSQTAQQNQFPSGQQYSHLQTSQMMGYHQQNQHPGHGSRPGGVDVPGYAQKGMPPSMGAASPQYRAPFPQLSPQMSPRSQMSPRPQPPSTQQMSPRPVMSPAKPTTLSPHSLTPKSTSSPVPNFGSQSTLQQLEQMVPPYQTRTQPQTNPQSPAIGSRIPLSPQSWSQSQPSTQQQNSVVENQMQNASDNTSFHSISTPEEAIPTSTLDSSNPNEKSKSNINLEPHGSTLLDNNCASPNEGGPSSSIDSKSSEPKKQQSHSSPLHPQGQLPNSSPLNQPHSSPHQSSQVSQGLSPHPSHTSPHTAPSHPSPHPSLSSPHLSPGQPLQSPHPTTSQPTQSSSSQQGAQQLKEQDSKIDNINSSHSILSPTQHVISGTHHSSHQPTSASHSMNLPQISLNSSEQNNPKLLGTQNQSLGGVMGNMNPHPNLSNHGLQGVGSHMSTHGQLGSHLGQHINQQHMGPSQGHVTHIMGPGQNQASQMIPTNQQPQPPHMGGHGMPHLNQSNRFSDYPNSQYQNNKMDDLMSVENRQFGSQMENSGMDHSSNRGGRIINMGDQMLGMNNQQGIDPTGMRMMAGRQQANIYSSSPSGIMSGGTMMGMGMGGSEMFSHQQEIAALQQQLQELYCMPNAPMHQEKMTQLEERLRTLQQHEAATQCQGGPLCVLPGPMFGASLIQGSPQVTSTTGRGRGRGRGAAKPRKTKKQKLAEQQQQQLLEQQHMMMHQQQYRQMGYQSKGMPMEMNPMMGTMNTMPNMSLMNNMGGGMVTNNPNMGMNQLQSNPNIPAAPNLTGNSMMPPNNLSGVTPNQNIAGAPPNMALNPNLVGNSGLPLNPAINPNLNLTSNNPNMTTNPNMLLNPNMGVGMNPANSGLIPNPNVASGNIGISSAMTSNRNLNSSNVNIGNSALSGVTDMNSLQGIQPQTHGLGHTLNQNQSQPHNSNQNQIQSHNVINNNNSNLSMNNQNTQPTLSSANTVQHQPSVSAPIQQCSQTPQQSAQHQQPQQQQSLAQSQPQLQMIPQTPPALPMQPPQSPQQQQIQQLHSLEVQPQQEQIGQSQQQPQLQQQEQLQQPQQNSFSDIANQITNNDSLSPPKQIPRVPTPSSESLQGKINSPVETSLPETMPATEDLPPCSSPTSSLTESNIKRNLLQTELNSTCDVDSSTNPEQESQSTNPYDFQSSFCSPYEKNSYSRDNEDNEIDPYLMTDEALGGEIIPRKIRKQRKPRESKILKEPKTPKEPKIKKPRTPKSARSSIDGNEGEKAKSPRKRREPKSPKEHKTPSKRGPKKRKLSDAAGEEWEALEAEEKRFFSLEDMAATKKPTVSESEINEEVTGTTNETYVKPENPEEVKPEIVDPDITSEMTTSSNDVNTEKNSEVLADTTPKKRGRRRDLGKSLFSRSKSNSFGSLKRGRGGPGRKKKGLMDESDEDGVITTPPPSPGEETENSNKRRSARNTQRKKYCDDIMLAISDEDSPKSPTPDGLHSKGFIKSGPTDPAVKPNFVYVNTTDEDSMVVQHILAVRRTKREVKVIPESASTEKSGVEQLAEVKTENPEELIDAKKEKNLEESENEIIKDAEVVDKDNEKVELKVEKNEVDEISQVDSTTEKELNENKTEAKTEFVDVEEYFVKYRNFSYLHCEWKTEEELRRGDRRIFSKIKRFQQKMANNVNIFEYLEDEPFNPDFIEIDRVLDVAEHTDPATNTTVKHYLVKWRSMQYDDSTWELEVDVDPLAVKQFERFRKIPPKEKLKSKKRPHPDQWRKLEKSPIYKNNNTLRLYQLEGLNWLLFSWHNGRNCILADEMGLGKTIQSLAFVNSIYNYGIRGPFLVIAPLSTIPNWQREFEAWTDLNVVVYHGSAASLQMIQEYEFYFKNDKGILMKDLHKFNVLITTFELIITHSQELKGFNWRICVIDEAHRLKNRNCKLLEGLRLLNMEHRVLLSGTPLQNNVNELFSLLNFLEPAQFSSSEAFLQEFGALKTESEVSKLQAILKPMMLRRMKEDVEKSLAPKEETVIEVELTNIQKKYYRGILERNFSFLSKGTTSSNIPNLMNTMMELRKCCIHPYLLNGAEEQIQIDYKNVNGDDPDAYYKALIHSSGKMVLVDKLLPKLKSNGHRVLIFSQMVKCLDILEDYLIYRKYSFERIDGRIRGDLRQAAIDRFCRPDSDRFVFLLCTKAGGLGINLTAADTVIIYDSDWNPQNDLQAQARCHRIGQQKMVKVYRLICRNTYEREMFDKASLKLGLDKAVLQSMNTSQGGKDNVQKQLSKKEIEDLLKRGAYGAIMDEDSAGDKFCEEDIDQILERRTQIITLESEKGSTFSKASFASSGIRSDINVDDPDFWKKWAKKADIDTTEKDENEQLVVSEPRRRTQIKRYGQDEATLDISDLGESSGPSAESDDDTSLGVGRGRGKKSKFRRRRRHQNFHHSFMGEEYGCKDGGEIPYGSWSRSDCFKVEKGLLTFGWDRWPEIMYSTQFRKGWRMQTVEDCARVILVYCLRYYRGDEKIRNFIWDLITPCEYGSTKIGKNHHGLSAPVPRGRNLTRSKNKNKERKGSNDSDHWSNSDKYDGETILESNYKKHLSRHANKVLLRVRLLYYIKHEIIGDLVFQINEGVHASALLIHPPSCDQAPTTWWDSNADKSLLVGTYKHGYECYSLMRNDPLLCFLARVGPDHPCQERNTMLDEEVDKDTEEDTMEGDNCSATCSQLNINEENSSTGGENSSFTEKPSTPDTTVEATAETSSASILGSNDEIKQEGKLDWPTIGDLNTRLRRVITCYQKNFRKEEIKQLQKARKIERREKIEQIVREREKIRLEISQKKWSRREEVDFFRTITAYGVEYDKNRKQYDWTKFRSLSRLDKKTDESMTEYYNAFYTMLKRSCGLKILEDEECQDLLIEPLNEEKARKTLEVIEILSKIREEILPHPKLDQRLKLCKTSADVPDWWVPGKHDKDLLKGVAKHGIGRTDYYLLNDPELSFKDVVKMNLVDDPASFLREKFAESFKAECSPKDKLLDKNVKNEVKCEIDKTVKDEPLNGENIVKDNTEVIPKEENEIQSNEPADSSIDKQTNLEDNTKSKCEEDVTDEEASQNRKDKSFIRKGKRNKRRKKSENNTKSEKETNICDTIGDVETELEGGDGDDEAEEDEEEDNGVKIMDESVYDFEDELDVKEEKHAYEKSSKKSNDEKLEGNKNNDSDEKLQTSDPQKAEQEDVRDVNEKAKETSLEIEKIDVKCEKINPDDKIKKEIVTNGKDNEVLSQISKLQKHFTVRKSFKDETFKHNLPELEIIQPWARLHELDHFLWRDRCSPAPSEPSLAQLIAHSYQNPIKWPRDHAILVRLQHIIHAVEHKEWPVSSNFSAYSTGNFPSTNLDLDISARNTPEGNLKRDSSTPMSLPEGSEVITITTDHAPKHHLKKKKHHIAIDVETERAKLHALLNCAALGQSQHQNMKAIPLWEATDESLSEDSRRSTPVSLHPPPAHQQTPRTFTGIQSNLTMPFDLSKFHSSTKASSSPAGNSNTLAPIDLSSGLSKSEHFKVKESEIQDLSIAQDLSSKSKQSVSLQKSKLENTLDKLLKRKNCLSDEPVVDKEKKRRKLDAIVLGLSAAKEQQNTSLFTDLKKPSCISPSVTVTPASAHPPPSSTPVSKPFTITVTSVPASSAANNDQEKKKDTFSTFLAQEQQHGKLLLKQQQHLLQQQQSLLQQQALSSLNSSQSRKSYEAMVSDLSKLDDLSKLGTYAHDSKASGSKAPFLKRLAQWLKENPMYDVDHKWSELVKEKGNLTHDVPKRTSTTERKNKSHGRTQTLGNSPESASSSSSVAINQPNLATSMASSLTFPSLASAGLGSLPTTCLTPGLLSGLALGNFDPKNPLFDVKNNPLLDPKNNPFLDPKNHPLFDPKSLSLLDPKNPLFDPKNNALFDPKGNPFFDPKNNPLLEAKNNPLFDPKNPLLLPFGGLPSMGALSGVGPLSNSMNFFANLASSMGLPSLSSLDPNSSGSNAALPTDQASPGSSGKGKARKSTGDSERHSSSKTPPISSSTSSSSTTSIPNSVAGGLPFYFPNPSLLYSPLGLGGLNPFPLPPAALSSAYDNLAQQCGLLNGALTASTSGSQSSRGNSSHRQSSLNSTKLNISSMSPSSSHRHHRSGKESMDRHSLQHLLLPHDAHLLESLGRVSSVEAALRNSEKRTKENSDKKESSERSEKRSRDNDFSGKSSTSDFSSTLARNDERQSRRSTKTDHDKKDSISTQSLLMSSLSEIDDRMLRRLREPDMKEAIEVLSRSQAEFLAKSISETALKGGENKDFSSINMSDIISRTIEEHSAKRTKETSVKEALALSGTSITEVKSSVDSMSKKFTSSLFSDVPESGAKSMETSNDVALKKKTREKSSTSSAKLFTDKITSKTEPPPPENVVEKNEAVEAKESTVEIESAANSKNASEPENKASLDFNEKSKETEQEPNQQETATSESKGNTRSRKGRNGKKSRVKTELDDQPVVERKNLRSSAGRAARAAAERAALKESGKEICEKSEDEDEQKQNDREDS